MLAFSRQAKCVPCDLACLKSGVGYVLSGKAPYGTCKGFIEDEIDYVDDTDYANHMSQ